MSYEPLHHKYRPQSFGQLVGQDAIAATLTNAIRQNRIAPAYLFTGPRGTGKTSSARILAKSLNCLSNPAATPDPCGVCDVCRTIAAGSSLDVIEIDAASNTGVDNIRELIERSQFAPVQCRHKVYIIDEVHMLSVAAFNALLKTLEEPPKNVVFVLATTDPQRVLPTIISRCQRFDFRRIPQEAMVQHLQAIANLEQIEIQNEAIKLVAQIAQGGLRDAESLLDQLSLLIPPISVEKVWDLVGSVPEQDLMALLIAVDDYEPQAVLDRVRNLMDRGREPLIVLQNLAAFYRDLLIAKTAPERSDLVSLTAGTWQQLCQFSQSWDLSKILAGQKHLRESEAQIKNTTQPRLWLEVTLLGLLSTQVNQPAEIFSSAPRVSPPPVSAPMSQPTIPSVQPIASPTEAIAASPPAKSGQPQNPQALIHQGLVLLAQKDYAGAIASFDQAIAIDHNLADAWYNKGLALDELQRHKEASECFSRIPNLRDYIKSRKPFSSHQTPENIPTQNPVKFSQTPTPSQPSSVTTVNNSTPQNSLNVTHPEENLTAEELEVSYVSELEQIWQAVINHIDQHSTQSLLRQNSCYLKTLTEYQGIVIVPKPTPTRISLLQRKSSEIEAAFLKVLNRRIKVIVQGEQSLAPTPSQAVQSQPATSDGFREHTTNGYVPKGDDPKSEAVPVDTASETTTPPEPRSQFVEQSSKPTRDIPSQQEASAFQPSPSSNVPRSSLPPLRENTHGIDSPLNLEESTQSTEQVPELIASVPTVDPLLFEASAADLSEASQNSVAYQDFQSAVERLATFFKGEIVNLDNDVDWNEPTVLGDPGHEASDLDLEEKDD